MKLISWNVNGMRAVHDKDVLLPLLASEAPDVLMLQETKAHLENLSAPLKDVPGYYLKMHSAKKRGYSGVGIYTREEPDEWIEGLGVEEFDDEGRVLGARFADLVVLSAYFPNSQAEGKRIDYRLRFGAAMISRLAALRTKGYHVALSGDFNVSHQPIDLARPKANVKNAGFLPAERQWMTEFLAEGYVDTWRRQNPETADVYTWWSYRSGARPKNIGWRLDYVCVDEGLMDRVGEASIMGEVMGSDHCPVALIVD